MEGWSPWERLRAGGLVRNTGRMKGRAAAAGISVVMVISTVGAGSPSSATDIGPAETAAGATTPALIDAALDAGRIDLDAATRYRKYALTGDARLPSELSSDLPWRGTLAYRDIVAALDEVSPSTRDEARPRGGPVGGVNPCGFSQTALPFVHTTEHFYIEYGVIGGGLTIDDYASALETSWATQVDTFGWAAPPLPAGEPFDGRYHVRVDLLPLGLYGFVAPVEDVGDNPSTAWDEGDAYTSCMGLNADYTFFAGTPLQAMQATAAHEFNHSVQFGYGALLAAEEGHAEVDAVFAEGGATWMEDQVFDSADDNHYYLWPDPAQSMGNYNGSPYSYWIVFQSLTERLGDADEDAFQLFWEQESKNLRRGVQAFAYGIGRQGVSMRYAFHHGAIALSHAAQCGGRHVLPYCFAEGDAYRQVGGPPPRRATLAAGATRNDSIEDHYSSHLFGLPGAKAALPLRLENRSTAGKLRASVVCEHNDRLLVGSLGLIGPGETATFDDAAAANCAAPVLVITNETVVTNAPLQDTTSAYRVTPAAP